MAARCLPDCSLSVPAKPHGDRGATSEPRLRPLALRRSARALKDACPFETNTLVGAKNLNGEDRHQRSLAAAQAGFQVQVATGPGRTAWSGRSPRPVLRSLNGQPWEMVIRRRAMGRIVTNNLKNGRPFSTASSGEISIPPRLRTTISHGSHYPERCKNIRMDYHLQFIVVAL